MLSNTINALSQNLEPGATGIHYFAGDELMEITTADKTLMTKIRRAAKTNKEVVIDQEPNIDNGGFMLALVPTKILRFSTGTHKREMTEEQKKACAERLRKARSK